MQNENQKNQPLETIMSAGQELFTRAKTLPSKNRLPLTVAILKTSTTPDVFITETLPAIAALSICQDKEGEVSPLAMVSLCLAETDSAEEGSNLVAARLALLFLTHSINDYDPITMRFKLAPYLRPLGDAFLGRFKGEAADTVENSRQAFLARYSLAASEDMLTDPPEVGVAAKNKLRLFIESVIAQME